MRRDANSIIYALLSQINPQKYGNKNLMHTSDPYYLLYD
jgi:hypothetical protein